LGNLCRISQFHDRVAQLKSQICATKGHGPLRAAAPTGWFLAVIYVIMVKNTLTRLLFPQKKWRNRAEARCQIVEKNPAQRFFDSLLKKDPLGSFFMPSKGERRCLT
jgi:hypothetical protein